MNATQSQLAVIWDMDGVIVDSEPLHCSAWRTTFKKHGVKLTEEEYQQFSGRRDDDTIRHFMGKGVSETVIASVSNEKQATFRQLVAAEHVIALPGAILLIHALSHKHVKQALASSAPIANIKLILDMLELTSYFPVIISATDVTRGKPDPQAFLIAAKRLEIEPMYSIVIEDAVAGVAAGKAAGMKVIAVTTTNPRDKLAHANVVVDSLEEISFAAILKLSRRQA